MDSGAYGVQVGNKFELFLDDASDPEELEQRALEQARVAQEKKKKEEQKKKLAPPPKKEAAPKAGAQPAAQKGPPAANNNSTGFSQPAKKEGFEEGKENKPERGGFRGGFRGGRGEGRGGFRGDRGGRGRGGGGGDRGGGTGGGPKANFTNFPEGEVPPRFAQQQQVQPEGGGDQPKKFEDRFGESRGGFGRGRGPRGGFRGEFRGRGRGGGAGRPPAQEGGGNFGEWNGPPPAGGEEGQQQQGGKGFGQLIEDAAPPAKGGFGTFSVTNADEESGDVTGFKEGRGGRGYNRGRGNRGGGRGGNFGGRGRQFERHSGSDKTGVKPVEKRDGGGAYNWGDTNDELKGETEPLDTTVGSDEQAAGEKPAEGGEGKEDGGPPAQAVEPEPIVMTLDEWKKRQEPRERPQFNIRRAGEGEDDKQWKKLVPLQKEIKTSDGDEHEDEEHEDRRKHKTVDLSINFFDEAKRVGGGPGGGERGGFGRGRGRGEGRGGFGGDRGGGGGFRGDREGRGGFRGDRGGEGRGGFRGDRGGGFRGDRGGFSGGGGHRGGGGGGGRGRGHAEEFSLAGESFPELSSAA